MNVMKKNLIKLSSLLLCTLLLMACGGKETDLRIIPQPQSLKAEKGSLLLPRQSSFMCNLDGIAKEDFISYVEASDLALQEGDHASPIQFLLVPCDKFTGEKGDEAYRLTVTKEGVKAEAVTAAGLFYAYQTLLQLAQFEGEQFRIPCVKVEDTPRFGYRGLHLDVSRHFRSKEFVMKQLDAMARYKMNRMHWHLTDGAGWRIEIKSYPKLTEMTAYRPYPDWKKFWFGGRDFCAADAPGAQGGYYTQEDIREVVEYARQRHITIIPEIEMPAHSDEVFTAYPELLCRAGLPAGGELCPGKEDTYVFLTKVLEEVMELFPSEYIHIGGDEASTRHWEKCVDCQRKMRQEGMKEVKELQPYLITRIEKFLQEHDRKMLGWDEILSGELSKESAVMVWRGVDKGVEALRRGLPVVLSPGSHCYLDSYQDAPASQPEAIGGYLPLQKVYAYEPVEQELTAEESARILGVQANVWAEYIPTDEHMEYMIYPRLLAIAEVGWSQPQLKDWNAFYDRALQECTYLQEKNYHTFDLATEIGERPVALQPDNHLAKGKTLTYAHPYFKGYTAGGDSALVDGVHGGWAYGDQRWQGFLCKDVDAVIDMENVTDIHEVSADFMQLIGPEVWLPKEVTIAVSVDGTDYQELITIPTTVPVTEEKLVIQNYAWQGEAKARYIRLQGKLNRQVMGWLFIDEIVVK